MVVKAAFFHIPAVVFIGFPLLVIIEIAVPVGIKIQKLSALFQHPKPFPVCLIRMRKIPCQVPGNDHIKALILKLQGLGIHPLKFNIAALFSNKFCRIFSSLFQHSRGVIHSRYVITSLSQNHWKKARACTDIQDPQLFLVVIRKFFFQKSTFQGL